MININHAELAFAVGAVEEGIRFDSFEDKFQERFGSRATLPAITFYTLANWVVNTYKPAILKDMVKRTEEVRDEEASETVSTKPQICHISVRRRLADIPGGPYTDDIIGDDLSLRIHDGYIDITDTDGKRYLCPEKDAVAVACYPKGFPIKKEDKDD